MNFEQIRRTLEETVGVSLVNMLQIKYYLIFVDLNVQYCVYHFYA